MASPRILLLCAPGTARESHLHELNLVPASVDVIDTIDQLESCLIDTPYNGMIFDVPTTIRASGIHKQKIMNIFEYYPVLKITHRKGIGISGGKTQSRSATIAEFIQNACAIFKARPLRSCLRCNENHSVMVLTNEKSASDTRIKAYTINVTSSGCFIATPEPPSIGSIVKAVFPMFENIQIGLQVGWILPWGETNQIPGFCGKFLDLQECQILAIRSITSADRR